MSENQGPGQPQRYCRNCGAELRPGTAFCTSCGAGLSPPPLPTGPQASRTSSPEQTGSPASAWRPGPTVEGLRRLPGRAVRWLRDLPRVPKLVLAGAGVLVVLVVLSPVTSVIAVLVGVVSLVALAVKAFQGRSMMGWGVAAAASLVLALVLGGVSGALYGTGTSETGSGSEDPSRPTVSGGNSGDQYASVPQDYAEPDVLQFKEYQIGSFEAEGLVPEYEVIDASDNGDYSNPFYFLQISTGEIDEDSLRAIAEEMAPQYELYKQGGILVFDESLQPYNPDPYSDYLGIPKSALDGKTLSHDASIVIEHYRGMYKIGLPS